MSEDDPDVESFLGTSTFGAKAVHRDVVAALKRAQRQTASISLQSRSNKNDSDSDSVEDSSDDELELPVTHEVTLRSHQRPVPAIGLDPAATRIASGSYDGSIALWDFGGMNADPRPFNVLDIFESHQLRSADFNSSGELILFTASNWQPKITTRDGEESAELPRGDPYLRDLRNTRGHVGEVVTGAWHPKDRNRFISASADSTVRIWDVNSTSNARQVIVHKSKTPGISKIACTAAVYSPDGKIIAAAYQDGFLNLWHADGPYHRPMGGSIVVEPEKHKVTSIALSQDGFSIATRSTQGIKLWDNRQLKNTVATMDNLPSSCAETNIIFSPDNQYIMTGTTTDQEASICIVSSKTLQPLYKIPFESPVVRVIYNAKINQILTGHADGNINVLFSPTRSMKGARLAISRAPKARHVDDLETADIDQTAIEAVEDPEAVVLSRSKARNDARRDPKASKMPSKPDTRGAAPQLIDPALAAIRDQDPREALLAYDEKAKSDPRFFGIYAKTQPVPQFAELEDSIEADEETQASKRFKFTHRK